MSPFNTLYEAIMARLQSKCLNIKHINQDLGQLELEQPPVNYPCVLIDFNNWAYEDLGENKQLASGTISIRLAVDVWSNTSHITPEVWRQKGMAFYDLEWQIYKALHGWKPEGFGYLTRTGVATEPTETNLRIRTMTFSCVFEDDFAEHQYKKVRLSDFVVTTSYEGI